MAKNKQSPPANFEQAMSELEKILSDMERGEVPLEESLVRYERGNYLIGFCRQLLGKAQQQIEQLGNDGPEKNTEKNAKADAAGDGNGDSAGDAEGDADEG